MNECPEFFGKYRGQVANNVDPMKLGRIQVSVPSVLGDGTLSWAMPCVPYAGPGVGFFAIPPIGANVWVEFESGDPDYPIWSGCFWADKQIPTSDGLPFTKVFKTDAITLKLDDTPTSGGFTLEVGSPLVPSPITLVVNTGGIELKNGSATVQLTTASVSVNNGALEVI